MVERSTLTRKKIRNYNREDLSSLHCLIQETISFSYPAFYSDVAINFFKEHHSKDNISRRVEVGKTVLVEENARIIATGSIVGSEISGVFVLPEKQKHGLGREVMALLEDEARKTNIVETHLDISLPARSFYESLGYEITQFGHIDLGNNETLDYWQAKKNIKL